MGFDLESFVIGLIVIILSISLHEFGHAISADRLGDPGPRRDGRVTLWPDKHFDMLGFIMIVVTQISGFGIGWGKPVMVDPRRFRHPRRDDIIVAAFGPLMNLLIAIVAGLAIRALIMTESEPMLNGVTGRFLFSFLIINLSLMFFNLLPIFPLDGSHILRGLLPDNLSVPYFRFMVQWGPMILLALVFLGRGVLGTLIGPAMIHTARLLIGNV